MATIYDDIEYLVESTYSKDPIMEALTSKAEDLSLIQALTRDKRLSGMHQSATQAMAKLIEADRIMTSMKLSLHHSTQRYSTLTAFVAQHLTTRSVGLLERICYSQDMGFIIESVFLDSIQLPMQANGHDPSLLARKLKNISWLRLFMMMSMQQKNIKRLEDYLETFTQRCLDLEISLNAEMYYKAGEALVAIAEMTPSLAQELRSLEWIMLSDENGNCFKLSLTWMYFISKLGQFSGKCLPQYLYVMEEHSNTSINDKTPSDVRQELKGALGPLSEDAWRYLRSVDIATIESQIRDQTT